MKGSPCVIANSGNIRSAKRWNYGWIILLSIVLVAASGYAYYKTHASASQAGNSSGVTTTMAQRGDLILSASGTGTLIAQSDASFGFRTSGTVTDISVKIGDQVEAGQVLAQLDHTQATMDYEEAQQALQELRSAASIAAVQQEIATAQDAEYYAREWLKYLISPEVFEAEENVAIAKQKLAQAQANSQSNPSEAGDQTVKEREAALAFLQEKLTQAQAYYENEYLIENFGVYEQVGSRRFPKQVLVTYTDSVTGKELPEIEGPSTADIATARNNYVQAQQTITEGQAYLEALRTGIIPEDATGTQLNSLYDAQWAVKNAKSALDATQLIAPISGTVTALDFNVGEQVGSSSVVTISQLGQPYILDVYLDEADWTVGARVGNPVKVTFDLLPEKTFPGTVTLVYPELNPSFESSLVHLIVQLDQSLSQDLPVGTAADVEVVGGEARGVVLVPVNAIHKTADGKQAVYILQNGAKTERLIEIGLQNTSYAEVKSGLEAGEIVVTK